MDLPAYYFFYQLRHVVHQHDGKKSSWYRLGREEDANARTVEHIFQQFHTTPPHNEIVWSCAHCRDLPEERNVMGLGEVMVHVNDEYVVFHVKRNSNAD